MTFASLPVFKFFVFTIDDLPVYKNLTKLTKKEKNGRKIHFDFRPIARYLFLLVGDAVECLKKRISPFNRKKPICVDMPLLFS